MPIRDQAAMERSLDNDYGTTRGPNAPLEFDVCLFHGDPMTDGVEISDTTEVDDGAGGITVVPNGYAPAYHHNDDWLPAEGGIKKSSPNPQFGETLAAWQTVTHWALRDRATGQWWDCQPLTEELEVTGPGDPHEVALAVFYGDNLDIDSDL